ncbi:E3 ubiquitin-protein ligase TOM1 [Sporobolomyces salmoneus]|uniref:E3 ubiquitin-protein ligase TOM1 n=1 Tax=Sporobolomyces salmoneus TaxID=183962 RepID=UPI00316B672B
MRLKRTPKRGGSANPGIANFIDQIQRVPQDELPSLLDPLVKEGWKWPRSDMQHWIYPLNRFDEILEQIIKDYDLSDMEHCQTNDFTPRTKQVLLSILAFQKLLLENSTNRKIFNGFDRINDLLQSTDVEVLLATLRLALRPAQQYSSINSSLSSISFSEKRLLSLAQPWGTREDGIDTVDIAQDKTLEIPLELQEPEWQFYRKSSEGGDAASEDTKEKGKEVEMEIEQAEAPGVQSTPAPPRRATSSLVPLPQTPATPAVVPASTSTGLSSKLSEGLTNIHLPNLRTTDKNTVDVLLDLIETHRIPEPVRLDLLQKIRIGKALSSSNPSERQALLVVRLLALSVFAHAQRESVAQTKVFLYEPELIPQLAELLHPDQTGVSYEVQAAALYALEAFARYKGKTLEVASALNASVSHGVLMQLIRRTATDLEREDSKATPEFVDALFNLLTYINMHQNIGAMVIGAGIVNALLEFVKNHRRDRFIPTSRAITLLDGFLYGYTQAFTAYIAAGGLTVFVDRIKSEVDTAVEEFGEQAKSAEPTIKEEPTGFLSFSRGTLLKNILRATQRLMTTAGTTEGLRNLIDTSLLGTVKKVMENRRVFGPQVFSFATSIATSFVHNEPTHLATLQEHKVPDAFYDSLEGVIPESIEVLQAIPHAMGAFCLDQAGIEQLTSRSLITAYFDLYLSPPHVTILRDRDSAVLLGGNIDELVRHQPSLRERVMSNIIRVFEEIKKRGQEFVQPEGEVGYSLLPAKKGDDEMAIEEADSTEQTQSAKDRKAEQKKRDEDGEKENDVTMMIDVFGRFLEGLFQNLGHCQEYFKQEKAFTILLDLLDLPCSPALMQKNGGYGSIVALFRIATEVQAFGALEAILKRTEIWLGKTEWFWSRRDGQKESVLGSMVNPSPEDLAEQADKFRQVSILLSHVTLLSDVVLNLSYSNGKVATSALKAFTGDGAGTLDKIGRVYRQCTWENVTIRPTSFWTGEASKASTEESTAQAVEDSSSGGGGVGGAAQSGPSSERQLEKEAEKKAVEAITTRPTPESPNIKLVQDVVQAFTTGITPLLTTLIKLLLHRRSADMAHRRVATDVAHTIGSFMSDTLRWPEDEPDASELHVNIAYSAQSFILITKLLFDERPNMTGLQTFLLKAFMDWGGLEYYLELLGKFQNVATDAFASSPSDDSTPSPLVIPVFGGLKTALELLSKLTSQKTILEAPQTALMITREKNPMHPDFFDAHAFIVRLRHETLPVLRRMWEQPWLRRCPVNVVRNLVSTLVNILKAEGEISVDPSSRGGGGDGVEGGRSLGQILGAGGLGGALNALGAALGAGPAGLGGMLAQGGGPGVPRGIGGPPQPPTPLVPDETRISQLVDMGFPRGACETALRRCRNNIGLATEYLLQHPDIVGAARADEARALLEPAPAEQPAQAQAEGGGGGEAEGGEGPQDVPQNAEQPATNEGEQQPEPVDPQPAPAQDVEMDDSAATNESENKETEDQEKNEDKNETKGPSAAEILEQARKRLTEAREELKPQFLDRALTLAEDYGDLVFDIKNVYSLLTASNEKGTPSIQPLLDQLADYNGEKDVPGEKAAATRLRLLALLTTDAAYRETIEPSREAIMSYIVRLQAAYQSTLPAKASRPLWLASTMLIADSLFSIQTVPKPTEILAEGVEVPSLELIAQGPAWKEQRKAFFDLSMDVLEKGISTREVFLSTLRLLLVLTRDHAVAASFAERNGPRLLFSAFTEESPETKGCRSYVVMILRHVIEEPSILKPMMEREIETWFSNGRSKVADITGFLRGISSVAFRNTETFLEAAKSTLKLVAADAPHHYHVSLLKDPASAPKHSDNDAVSSIKSPLAQGGGGGAEDSTTANTGDATMDDAAVAKVAALARSLTPSPAATESTIHFLMAQVLESSKGALAPIPLPEPVQEGTDEDAKGKEKEKEENDNPAPSDSSPSSKPDKDAHIPGDVPLGDFYQTAFTLACISELVAAYNPAKASFLTFSTRKGASSNKEVIAARSRSGFLYFLLNDLVPSAGLNPTSDFDTKRRTSLWGWASLVIVGLCYDSTAASFAGSGGDKDSAQEITVVRKAVLDAVARAYREAMASSEPTEVRYARLSALSDLCHRLLTARPFPHVNKAHSETSMQLAKLMLEKNFATILTNALAEVDLNFPNVNTLINAILRPLENLTKIVTKVGRAKNAGPARNRFSDDSSDDDLSSMSDDDDDDDQDEDDFDSDEEQQETPDLYRNSALGMYEGELETGQQDDQYMTGEDSEGYDEDDEIMEEMEDAGLEGSDLSDASDDEDEDDEGSIAQFDDEDMEDMEDEDEFGEGGSAIGPSDIEEEHLIEADSDDDQEEILEAFEDGFDDEGEEGGFLEASEDGEGERHGDELVFEGAAPIQAFDDEADIDDGNDSEEMFTDEEDAITGELEFDPEMTEQLRAQSTAQAYGWDPVTGGDGNGNRRNRIMNEDMMQLSDAGMFDRPRQTTHAATHPLLVEAPATESAAAANSRRSRGGATSRDSPAYQEWVRSIEAMLGPNGLNTLQDVLGSHGLSHLSGPDQLRVQLAPGPNGGMAVVIDPSPALRNGTQGIVPEEPQPARASAGTSSRSAARQISDRINAASAFLPVQTNQRWQEEGRILQGSVLTAERVARLVNHLINILHPPAREIAKEEKKKEEERRKKREEEAAEIAKKEAEERKVREAEEQKRREEEEERELEKKRKEEEEAAEAESRRRQEQEAMEVDQQTTSSDVPDDVAEVMNLARSLAAGLAVPSTNSPTPDATRSATPSNPQSQSNAEAGPSNPNAMQQDEPAPTAAERVTIMIHGEEVDITDTGVDREFLEALPDDMREEVLSQHFRETRSSGPPPVVPSHINAEFLDALPPDLRAEVLRQEAAEQRRQEEAASRAARADASSGDRHEENDDGDNNDEEEDRDRDQDQGEDQGGDEEALGGFDPAALLAGLVGGVAGIGGPLGGAVPRIRRVAGGPAGELLAIGGGGAGGIARGAKSTTATAKKPTPHREVIQLLDKSGLATLVRLLFFPHPLRRNSLQKVLVHLCENSRTRVELINLLLTILQDGTRDVSAVDKSFSQMSIRASKSLLGKDKDTPKRKVPDTPGPVSVLPHFPGESVPNMIAQRCLEALSFLVSANDQTPLFFLTEQEVAVNRRAAKKGKGKEKAQPSSIFPLIILLGLLERPALLKTPAMMDSLTTLLASVTRSLSVLQKKPKSTETPTPAGGEAPATSSSTANAPSGEEATQTSLEEGTSEKGKEKEKDSDELPSTEILIKHPPQIPESSLRLVVNVLDAGECSSRTFSQTLTLIQNLSHLESGRDTILDELKARAEKISNDLIPDLEELVETINRDETVSSATLSKFTPASSSQAKLLRILKTIDFFGTAPKKTNKSPSDRTLSPEEERIKALYDQLATSDLWKRLGDALGGIEAKSELLYLSTVLLPLIESLLVVNKFTDSSSTEFIDFTTAHSKILNSMVRQNPSLMSGSFAVLVRNSTMLDFENKRSFFFSRLHDRNQRQRGHYGTINLNVRRAHVFEDSFHVLQRKSGDEIKYGKLNVKFHHEEGVDAGGVTREWFGVLARQMFNPDYALFQPQAADALTYQPNKSSSVNEEHLAYFRFVGRIIGKALHDQRILEAYFSRSVYKHMLGKPVDHRDLESIDPEYFKSLTWMLENDIEGVFELNFSVERDEFGVVEVIDLIPNGRNIPVTNENKAEYIRLVADQRLSIEIKDQMDALLKGLYEVVPKDLMQIFTERELELLISGLPEVDPDEWRANTDLVGYSSTEPIVSWFWRAVRSFTHEERAKLLQFVTGTSRVPLEGFAALQGMSGNQKFNIHRSSNSNALPTSHTCFNQLDIPSGYTSYEELRKMLLLAITEGNTGFAFA